MTEKTLGIVLEVKRHNEKNDIVTLLTPERGRIVFLSPAGSGKSGKMRNARLQPMSVIETEFRFKPNSEFHRLGGVALHIVWKDIYFHPAKRLIAIFLSDFLGRLLRATMPDTALWNFIYRSLEYLDSMQEGVSDFHIAFMCCLLPYIGIMPDTEDYTPGMIFDMREGRYTDLRPLHSDILEGEEAFLVEKMVRLNYSNVRAFKLNTETRRRLLDRLLSYYSVHFPGISSLHSLETLRLLN